MSLLNVPKIPYEIFGNLQTRSSRCPCIFGPSCTSILSSQLQQSLLSYRLNYHYCSYVVYWGTLHAIHKSRYKYQTKCHILCIKKCNTLAANEFATGMQIWTQRITQRPYANHRKHAKLTRNHLVFSRMLKQQHQYCSTLHVLLFIHNSVIMSVRRRAVASSQSHSA